MLKVKKCLLKLKTSQLILFAGFNIQGLQRRGSWGRDGPAPELVTRTRNNPRNDPQTPAQGSSRTGQRCPTKHPWSAERTANAEGCDSGHISGGNRSAFNWGWRFFRSTSREGCSYWQVCGVHMKICWNEKLSVVYLSGASKWFSTFFVFGPWWPSMSNSSRHSLEDPDLNPRLGLRYWLLRVRNGLLLFNFYI